MIGSFLNLCSALNKHHPRRFQVRREVRLRRLEAKQEDVGAALQVGAQPRHTLRRAQLAYAVGCVCCEQKKPRAYVLKGKPHAPKQNGID